MAGEKRSFTWKDVELLTKNIRDVSPFDVEPGSFLRPVRESGVQKLVQTIACEGYNKHLAPIYLIESENGGKERCFGGKKYKCIDGMHRVTAMRRLWEEKDEFQGINLRAVVLKDIGELGILGLAALMNNVSQRIVSTTVYDEMCEFNRISEALKKKKRLDSVSEVKYTEISRVKVLHQGQDYLKLSKSARNDMERACSISIRAFSKFLLTKCAIQQACNNEDAAKILTFRNLDKVFREFKSENDDLCLSFCIKILVRSLFDKDEKCYRRLPERKARKSAKRFKESWKQIELMAKYLNGKPFDDDWSSEICKAGENLLLEGLKGSLDYSIFTKFKLSPDILRIIQESYENHQEIIEFGSRVLQKEFQARAEQEESSSSSLALQEKKKSSKNNEAGERRIRIRTNLVETEEDNFANREKVEDKATRGKRKRNEGVQKARKKIKKQNSEEFVLMPKLDSLCLCRDVRFQDFKQEDLSWIRSHKGGENSSVDLLVFGPPRNLAYPEMEEVIGFAEEVCARNASVLIITMSSTLALLWKRFLDDSNAFETQTELTVLVEDSRLSVFEAGTSTITKFLVVAKRSGVSDRSRRQSGHLNLGGTGPQAMDVPNRYKAVSNVISGCPRLSARERMTDEKGNILVEDQLPVSLMKELVCRYSSINHVVCDPFSGAFTTGKACVITGRLFIGYESNGFVFKEGVRELKEIYKGLNMTRTEIHVTRYLPRATNSPPWVEERGSLKERLLADCDQSSTKVDVSGLDNAGMGLFAARDFEKDELIGFYWGRYIWSNLTDVELSVNLLPAEAARLISLKSISLVSSDEGLKDYIKECGAPLIAGSPACAATYANNKRDGTHNACIKEWPDYAAHEFNKVLSEKGQDVFLKPDMLGLFSVSPVRKGEEIFIDYGFDCK